jgi:uncharacterized membrane protein
VGLQARAEGRRHRPQPLLSHNQGAAERARAEAQEELARKLENDVEAIACPQCSKFQSNMIDEAKSDEFGQWYGLAFIDAIVGVIFSGFWGKASFYANWFSLPGCLFFISALAMCLYAAVRMSLFEPNADVHVAARAEKKEKPKAPVILRAEYEAVVQARPNRELAEIRWAA